MKFSTNIASLLAMSRLSIASASFFDYYSNHKMSSTTVDKAISNSKNLPDHQNDSSWSEISLSSNSRVLQTTTSWFQLGQDIDGEAEGDRSGWSVSMSSDGKIVAIGAFTNDGNRPESLGCPGHVRVWKYDEMMLEWTQLGQDIDGEYLRDESGYSVSMSSDGKTVAIGAPDNDGRNGSYSGHVRVWFYDETVLEWTRLGQDIDGEAFADFSGYSVSMSSDGKTVAIGAIRNDGNDPEAIKNDNRGPEFGHVRVWFYDETILEWTQLGQDIDGEAERDWSGESVSLSSDGKTVAIGAPNNDGNGSYSGHVRVWKYNETMLEWTQLGQDIDGETRGDESGESVSLSSDGKTVAIGAPNNCGNGNGSGHVRVWKYDEIMFEWTQLGQDIDGEGYSDHSGRSVSISSDGKTVAIGGGSNSIYGSGHVRVFSYDETDNEWTQLGQDIDGEAEGDYSGRSVSMSSDGKTVAIGAHGNDDNGNYSGHVRIFTYGETSSAPSTSAGKTMILSLGTFVFGLIMM